MNYSHSTLVLFIIGLLSLQTSIGQNALDFDGTNDVVTIPNASARISGSNNISLSCWVNASNTGGPHGFLGFRNNSNADFYILQLNNTSLECRFRNSAGTYYDIVYNGHVLNQWQHFVFTYNGSTLTLYKNGVSVSTLPASGLITNSSQEMLLGNTIWNATNFRYGGKMDEVGLWNKALSAAEVSCIYTNGINPSSANLQLYYDFDHGVAAGNNAGVTTLEDRAGNINGSLTGFSLNGGSSNWVSSNASYPTIINTSICTGDSVIFGGNTYKTSGTYFNAVTAANGCDSMLALHLDVSVIRVDLAAEICPNQTYSFGGMNLNTTGIYKDTTTSGTCDTIYTLDLLVRPDFPTTVNATICRGELYDLNGTFYGAEGTFVQAYQTQFGCDSSITLHLNIDTVENGITLNGSSLFSSAVQNDNSFQWFDCDDQNTIIGETNNFYTPPDHKEYAVIVTIDSSGCTDTTACLGLVTGIAESSLSDRLELAPNPVIHDVRVNLQKRAQRTSITITNYEGKQIYAMEFFNEQFLSIPAAALSPGVYFMQIQTEEGTAVKKFVKQ